MRQRIGFTGLKRSGGAVSVLGSYREDFPAPTSLDVVFDHVGRLCETLGMPERADTRPT